LKIAVIEDEKDLNLSITNILEKEGYEVDSFFDGESIFETNIIYDLYLIDINIPKIDGLKLIELLPNKKIIISANINNENIEIAYKKGAVDFIKKPFFKPELLYKIKQLFPQYVKIKDFEIDLDKLILKRDIEISLLKIEVDFLLLFKDREFVSIEDIEDITGKSGGALYAFLSRLRKKTGLEFKNQKGEGYRIV